MADPKPDAVQRLGLKRPKDFTKAEFSTLIVDAHNKVDVQIVETAGFLEPHANGEVHHNSLVRASVPFRWKKTAEYLFKEQKISVSYGANIKTWAEGMVYGCVASDHKPPEMLDQELPHQWAKEGLPMRPEDVIPRKWQAPGFQRRVQMTSLAFLDIVRKSSVKTVAEVWALATELEEKGDKALLTFALDNDVNTALDRALQAIGAKEAVRRSKMSRMDILQEYVANDHCTCDTPGRCFNLIKDILQKNNIDGEFQRLVVATLKTGRAKMRNICIVGGRNMGKTLIFKGLMDIFKTYERPDGGSYQLEDILDTELVFLNDFEYDEDAKKWLNWGYFKRLLEGGGSIPVARPKNRGGNVKWYSDAPVLMTAPQEIALWRGKKMDQYETEQMDVRVKYIHLRHTFAESQRVECNPCGHCTGRVYLEGLHKKTATPTAASGMVAAAPVAKRVRTGSEVVKELAELVHLHDMGVVDLEELRKLKSMIVEGL